MGPKRNDKKEEDDNSLLVGLGLGAAFLGGAGLLAYGGYKLIQSFKKDGQLSETGVNFNEWRQPKELTSSELRIAKEICDASETELNLKSSEWEKASGAVDKVLDMLMREIKTEADKYEGLVVEKYIRQGSSREGLKIHAADEFDVLLQYHFDDLEYEVENIASGNNVLPELAYLRVKSTMKSLEMSHPRLCRKDVFYEMAGNPYISTMALQEKVFKSVIAIASERVVASVNQGQNMEAIGFRINMRINPPSVNISIEMEDDDDSFQAVLKQLNKMHAQGVNVQKESGVLESRKKKKIIDVDIVPGLLLSEGMVPDPTDNGRTMSCPMYAVFKWLTENHRSASLYGANTCLLWRVCSSGYEKQVIDIARWKSEQMYIINALRILKLYFRNKKQMAIGQYVPPPQVVTVLRSYYLKHISFYCILFLRILNKVKVNGIKIALRYMLEFLGVCLEERRLPHFFHANENITSMFPRFETQPRSLRYDLFQTKRGDSLNQALLSFRTMKQQILAVIGEPAVSDKVVQEFRNYVSSGSYYG